MKRLAYLGPPGTFTNQAAAYFIGEQETKLIPYSDLKSLIKAVDNQEEQYGLVPIENSLEGAVNIVLDLLAHKVDLKIAAEVLMPINQYLIGQPGADLTEIDRVSSHWQALAQCRDTLDELLGDFETIDANSTSEAVCNIKDKPSNWSAIGSKLVAQLHNLEILAAKIQDQQTNWTRFVLLSDHDGQAKEAVKTSLICSPLENQPGILHEILNEFAVRNINLTKIESRPARKMLGDYIFFIDFEGHREDPAVESALNNLADKTSLLKILGSYPQVKVD
ncbi:MAG: prephenate dehydratase [Bacillota bacterium]